MKKPAFFWKKKLINRYWRKAKTKKYLGFYCGLLLSFCWMFPLSNVATAFLPTTAANSYEYSRDIEKVELRSQLFPPQNQSPENQPTPNLFMSQFPLGIYDRIDRPEHLSAIKNMGFNLVMPYTVPYARGNYQTIQTYLDRAQGLGLQVILEPDRKAIKEGNLQEIARMVGTFAQHPAVYGWYSYDEPVFNKISPQAIEQAYQTIKAQDPIHPVVLDFSGPRSHNLASYGNGFDLCWVNQYPLKQGVPVETAFNAFNSEISQASQISGSNFWLVLQSFKDEKKWRLPTYEEQRYMLYSGLARGAKGIFFYAYHRAPKDWQQKIVAPLVSELRGYLPAIAQGQVGGVQSDRTEIETLLFPSGNDYLLMAINHSNSAVSSQITIAKKLGVSEVASSQAKQTTLAQNLFSDTFAPYEVRFYQVN